MLYFVVFNAVMVLVGAGVVAKVISVQFLRGLVTALHYTIGISTPSQDQVRRAVIIWIVSVVLIVDMLFSLLRWAF
jgi:hypothetical protein